MAGSYNDTVARTVKQGHVSAVTTAFRPLVANTTVNNGNSTGQTPLKARRQVRYQIKGAKGSTLAIAYSEKNQDGTFTAPTDGVAVCTVIAGNSTVVEPLGDAVQIWGKLFLKAGETDASVRVIVTEYA